MAEVEVKLAARGARLHLNNEDCNIFVEKAHSFFTTASGIVTHDNEECVYVPKEQIFVPLIDITAIEIPVSRFTPDLKAFTKIAW